MRIIMNFLTLRVVILTCLLISVPPQVNAADYLKGVEAYINGEYLTALNEWKQLARQGHIKAQCDLAYMYSQGQGVPHDTVRAYAWYAIAASHDSDSASKSKDIISEEMSYEQIARGEALIKQLAIETKGKL